MRNIASELLYYRDQTRQSMGRKYKRTMNELGERIREVAKSNRESNLAAAMRVASGENDPPLTIALMAAWVEMESPS